MENDFRYMSMFFFKFYVNHNDNVYFTAGEHYNQATKNFF